MVLFWQAAREPMGWRRMDSIDQALKDWRESLCKSVDPGELLARNPVVYKWNATVRACNIREAASWRAQDLLYQSKVLLKQKQMLGSRILLRSVFETLAVLIYLNQSMRKVVDGTLGFHDFSEKTNYLMHGSRDESTDFKSVNILTILKNADKRYPDLLSIYETLCEYAHPNYDGLISGYSHLNPLTLVTHYANRWMDHHLHAQTHGISLCIGVFRLEYNQEWVEAMGALETWIEENDEMLVATKSDD